MEYRKQSDGSIVYGLANLKAQFPNTSFPKGNLDETTLDSLGYDAVFEGAQPTLTPPYERAERDGVEQISGKWYTKYKVGPTFVETTDREGNVISAADNEAEHKTNIDNEKAANVRKQRDEKLKETDFYGLDVGSMSYSIKTYRHELRDLPSSSGSNWPHNVTWPTKP